MAKGFFITGTDTGIGKTWISVGLITHFKQKGYQVAGMKPVASGCIATPIGICNEDALQLKEHTNISLTYSQVNPYNLPLPIAPHLAAQNQNVNIDLKVIKNRFSEIATKVDVIVVEGVGGWIVPINQKQTMVDVAQSLKLPVILVVGMKLGCLNHALLTSESILKSGLSFAGWIANQVQSEMDWLEDNIQFLRERLPVPLLGITPHLDQLTAERISECFTLEL
ncbi:dethiobiotin synthase [Candidatus Nitrosacidococcus tergens]|uniref:ATP-dependent dethiobiotin synthetase BioD n=1 Tax=Candidatus Nitrosacidococcus tergens TaxID=553981 RepID=A0A7G1QB33_9GAMM|nr:dethiobiotin synthase [Candidatus Nitrosacidococcus tergens]CAB1276987.1 dethiobiotin synthetase [Candidatus Nitrosacidococcus tergens]